MIVMIDTHCHLDYEEYENLEEVIQEMDGYMIVSGVNRKTNEQVIELCHKYNHIFGTIGFHPEYAKEFNQTEYEHLKEQLQEEKIVGVGEIGLDYHYGKEDMEVQKNVFQKQILLAQSYQMPIVVHSRDAIMDTYTMLKECHIEKYPSVLHCYSSSVEMAFEFLKLNMKFGIGGVVTFKNAGKLKDVVTQLPLCSLLLETDSPYLTPEPFRGERNKPSNVKYVAEKIAELREISVLQVRKETTKNACEVFHLTIPQEEL